MTYIVLKAPLNSNQPTNRVGYIRPLLTQLPYGFGVVTVRRYAVQPKSKTTNVQGISGNNIVLVLNCTGTR